MSQPAPSRDMSCVLQLGSITVSWSAEGVSWSPDVADDMAMRTIALFRDALAEAHAYGLLETDNEVMFDDGELAESATGEDEDGE